MTRLGERTWPEVDELRSGTLLVPLGSTEQHGPHLTLDTDTRIAVALCDAVAAELDYVVAAPPLAYGSSGEHQAFPGTISIGTDVLASLMVELARSALLTFADLVFVNGHGGNTAGIQEAVVTLHREGRPVGAWGPSLASADAHAGSFETSLVLAIAPDHVRQDRAESGNTTPITDLLDDLIADGLRPHAPNGILGDATSADTETGRTLFYQQVRALVSYLSERQSAHRS